MHTLTKADTSSNMISGFLNCDDIIDIVSVTLVSHSCHVHAEHPHSSHTCSRYFFHSGSSTFASNSFAP